MILKQRSRDKTLPILLTALGIIVVLGLVFLDMHGVNSGQAENPVSDAKQLDQLLRDVGVLAVPRDTTPVEFSLKDLDGNLVSISDLRGKIVLLTFWTTWCPNCREEMPSLQRLHEKLKNRDFTVVGIDLQESQSTVRGFVKEFNLTFRILLDETGKVGVGFRIRSVPTTAVLDKQGRILGMAIGPREWDAEESIRLFEYLAGM